MKFKAGDLVSIDSFYLEMGFTELAGTIVDIETYSLEDGYDEEWSVYRVMLPSEGTYWFEDGHLTKMSEE